MFDQAKADAICARIAEGASLRKACQEIGNPPSAAGFLLWCSKNSALAEQYARARATGTEIEFEELDDLQSQEPQRDTFGKIDPAWVAWRRLQVDTKKWALSKKAPRKYGEKIETTHEVGDSVKEIVRTIVRAP